MAKIVRYFLGANTPNGFCSRFDQLTDGSDGWRVYMIKGGPGTGKSTLMKRIRDTLTGYCGFIEEIRCSSDVDSLDGLILPELKTAIADATAPHLLEPIYPGARDSIISLCDCWNEQKLYEHRSAIIRLTDQISEHHRRAVRLLSGADAAAAEIRQYAAAATNTEKLEKYADYLFRNKIRPVLTPGSDRQRLLSAVTNQGPLCWYDSLTLLADQIYYLHDPWGYAAPLLLNLLHRKTVERKGSVITGLAPMDPFGRIEHLIYPEAKIAFTTVLPPESVHLRTIHIKRFTDMKQLSTSQQKLRFLQRCADDLTHAAAAQIAQAKNLHDDLEAYYVAAMDFEQCRRAGDLLLAHILK